MKKILTGAGYDLPRFAGIMHEAFVRKYGQLQKPENVTMYLDGEIKEVNGELGLMVDDTSEYYDVIPSALKLKLSDVTSDSKWNVQIEDEVLKEE